jgi:hypothetical protein
MWTTSPGHRVRQRANNPDFDAGVAYLTNYKMIWNSEAVSSGGARPYINFIRDNNLAVPAINVEGANVADWRLGGGSGDVAGGNANAHSVIITDPASPFAAGLPEGTHRVLKEGPQGQWMAGTGLPETVFGCWNRLGRSHAADLWLRGWTEGTLEVSIRRGESSLPSADQRDVVERDKLGHVRRRRWAMNLRTNRPSSIPSPPSGAGVVISWTGQGTLRGVRQRDQRLDRCRRPGHPRTVPAAGASLSPATVGRDRRAGRVGAPSSRGRA